MTRDQIIMSLKEVDKLGIIQKIEGKKINQKEGAKRLGITERQMRRLCKNFRQHGASSIASKKRGQPSNRRISNPIREAILKAIRENYADFGPTLAHEKLTEIHELKIGVETVRKLMIEAGLWKPRARKRMKVHQMRTRRPQRGELIQIDGSPHDWFEGRADKCCLLIAIDDATGEVMAAHFVKNESAEGYFELMESYLKQHGRPIALYSDRHGIFRVNTKEAQSGTGETQFSRAMKELGIEIICANSPQAKGRVERMNSTLQDRLIKEMRLQNVSGIAAGNEFLPLFFKKFNLKFTVPPASTVDAHRAEIPSTEILERIFSFQATRKASKSLEIQYNNIGYQIQAKTPSYTMRGASIQVYERKGNITLLYKGRELPYSILDKKNKTQEIVSSKDINQKFDQRSLGNKPKDNHPWKKNYPEMNGLKQGPLTHSLQ